jgi:hypothetical protein
MDARRLGDAIYAVERADEDKDAETRDDIRSFRADFGLPADDDVVEHMLAEYKADRQEEGMWLTDAEYERYDRRVALQTEAHERLGEYLAAHSQAFAGMWYGAGLDPEYNVAFTRDVDLHREALLRLYPHPDIVRVHHARYSLAELEAIGDRVEEDEEALAAAGVNWMGIGIDEVANRVTVEVVAPDAQTARSVLNDRYGPAVECEWLGSTDTDVTKVPWQLWSADADDRRLTVHYNVLAAAEFDRVVLDEDDRQVRVTLFVREPVGTAKAIGAIREASVELSAPVGGRRVIDGTTGRERERRIPEEVIDRSWELVRAYVAGHSDEYGGSWDEHPGCHVAFTSRVEAHREALLELLPEPDALVVHEVERTEAELLDLGKRVKRERGLLRSHGIDCVEPPHLYSDDNAMFVEIEAKDRETALRFMEDRYGAGLIVSWLPT